MLYLHHLLSELTLSTVFVSVNNLYYRPVQKRQIYRQHTWLYHAVMDQLPEQAQWAVKTTCWAITRRRSLPLSSSSSIPGSSAAMVSAGHVGVVPMAEVQAKDVHAGLHQFAYVIDPTGGGDEGCEDLDLLVRRHFSGSQGSGWRGSR